MSRLKVKFMRYKNMVIADVLEQDESLRGIGKFKSKGLYSIASLEYHAIAEEGTCLYSSGFSESLDDIVASNVYDNDDEAKEAIKNFTELINEINAEGKEDKTEEGFEVTIAG